MGIQVFECWIRRKRTKELLKKGYTVEQVGEELDVAVSTVKRYKRREDAA